MLSRVRTEQKNGLYQWDIWMAASSNMTNIAAPAGMMEKLDDLLILPEVKDMSNWLSTPYVWGDKGHHVFTFNNSVSLSMFANTDMLKGLEIKSFDDLFNPALKGKISMRDASLPNASSFVMALMQDRKGAAYVEKFIKEMNPTIYEDPLQIFNAVVRGARLSEIVLASRNGPSANSTAAARISWRFLVSTTFCRGASRYLRTRRIRKPRPSSSIGF